VSQRSTTATVKPAALKPLRPACAGCCTSLPSWSYWRGSSSSCSPQHRQLFAWTIRNPLGAAFLGAGYWASVAFEALAARQRIWANARIAVPTVLVFTVLTLVATLLNLGQFHLGGQFAISTRIVTWAWIAIYIVVPLLMVIILAVQLRTPGR
jgi:hypothetical protein